MGVMPMNDLRHHRIRSGEVELHAISQGNGPAVLLVHGFPQHSHMWRPLMQRLAESGFRAIAIDQRGMGGSDIPPSGYDKATLADDAFCLLDALGIETAAVVGYDHGGGTAIAMAFCAPDRVSRLAVVEYAPPGFGYEQGLVATPENRNWQLAFFTQPDIAVQFMAGKERELLAWYFWHWSHNPDAVSQDDFELYVRQLQKPGALRGGFSHFASVFDDRRWFEEQAASQRLTMPCLGIGGAAASSQYPGLALRAIADTVQEAIIDDAGHWIAEEKPDDFAEAIAAFLKAE